MSARKKLKEAERLIAYRDVFHYGKDIVETDIFKEAMAQTHHRKTTVGDHSASVAVIALRMCRKLNRRVCHLDERRVVLAALTHDLGIVGRHEKYSTNIETYLRHPSDSAKIAMDLLPDMNKKFYRSISRHMFPLTILPPTSMEGLIISVADKMASFKDISPRKAYSSTLNQ